MKEIFQNQFFRVYSPNGIDILVKSQGDGIGTDDSGDAVLIFPEKVGEDKYTPAVRSAPNTKTL